MPVPDRRARLADRPDLTTADVLAVVRWNWPAIEGAEADAKLKVGKLPRCRLCGQPLTLGQPGVHRMCAGATLA